MQGGGALHLSMEQYTSEALGLGDQLGVGERK